MEESNLGSPAAADPIPAVTVDPAAPTPASTDPESAPDTGAGTPKPKREGGFQKRIKELTREKYEIRQQNDRLLKLLEERNKAPGSPQTPARPKMEDFNSLDEYLEARDEWRDAVRESKAPKAPATPEREKTGDDSDPQFEAARNILFEEGSEKYEDFHEIAGNPDVSISPPMAMYIAESDMSVDLAYHLGKNPTVAAKISRMSPVRQVAALARLEDTLTKPARPSNAPDPVKPISGSGGAPSSPSESDDTATWIEKRRKQVHTRK